MFKKLFIPFILGLVINGYGQNVDVNVLRQLHTAHYTKADPAFKFLSNSTTAVAVMIPLSVASMRWMGDDTLAIRKAMVISAAYAIAGSISLSLKFIINRPRPFEEHPQYFSKKSTGGSSSFPSAHTSLAFSAATALSLQYPQWYVVLPSYLWAGSVAYSRMHLGVHYPSDVLAGAVIGMISAYVSYKANLWLQKKYNY